VRTTALKNAQPKSIQHVKNILGTKLAFGFGQEAHSKIFLAQTRTAP
jgi:hypothetical protein